MRGLLVSMLLVVSLFSLITLAAPSSLAAAVELVAESADGRTGQSGAKTARGTAGAAADGDDTEDIAADRKVTGRRVIPAITTSTKTPGRHRSDEDASEPKADPAGDDAGSDAAVDTADVDTAAVDTAAVDTADVDTADDESGSAGTEPGPGPVSRRSPLPSPATAPASHPVLAPGEWVPVVDMDSQLFPSFLFATALIEAPHLRNLPPSPNILGNRAGVVGIRVLSPADGAAIRIELRDNAILEASRFDGVLPKSNTEYYVFPTINWKFERMLEQRQVMPLNLVFTVTLAGKDAGQQTKTVMMRSLNDCVIGYGDLENNQFHDTSYMFAAYVNENHPAIDKILKLGLRATELVDGQQQRIVEGFYGYQLGEGEAVIDQVFAIWSGLQKQGIRYSSVTTPSGHSEVMHSQSVRFIDETMENSQANCVDGSVLLASALYKIGIRPFLVSLPDHMYVGFYLDDEGKEYRCLETTELGGSKGREHFDAVMTETTAEFAKIKPKLEKEDEADHQLIDIADARKAGILPIAARAK